MTNPVTSPVTNPVTSLGHDELRRVARQTLLPGFGLAGQERLHRAHVLVIGAGGLGCPLMQTLAATGVGRISVIDDDTVEVTNIHRQILFGVRDVGRRKVDAAAERLRALQPGIDVRGIFGRFDATTAPGLLADVDVLIDGSDNFATKFLAADAAELTGTPLVWGTVLRYHGEVAVWWSGPGVELQDPDSGTPDARGVGLRDLYPAHPDPADVPDCATAGVLGVTTSVMGGLMATETIRFLTGLNPDHSLPLPQARARQVGRLSSYDALSGSLRHFQVGADPRRHPITTLPTPALLGSAGPDALDSKADDLWELLRTGAATALDVRELGEKAVTDLPDNLPGAGHHLPTTAWDEDPARAEQLLAELAESNTDIVVYCASGVRSGRFVERFAEEARSLGITLHSLPGGANTHGRDVR